MPAKRRTRHGNRSRLNPGRTLPPSLKRGCRKQPGQWRLQARPQTWAQLDMACRGHRWPLPRQCSQGSSQILGPALRRSATPSTIRCSLQYRPQFRPRPRRPSRRHRPRGRASRAPMLAMQLLEAHRSAERFSLRQRRNAKRRNAQPQRHRRKSPMNRSAKPASSVMAQFREAAPEISAWAALALAAAAGLTQSAAAWATDQAAHSAADIINQEMINAL